MAKAGPSFVHDEVPYIPEAHHLRLPTEAELAQERRDARIGAVIMVCILIATHALAAWIGAVAAWRLQSMPWS